jgi:hypothetical protein
MVDVGDKVDVVELVFKNVVELSIVVNWTVVFSEEEEDGDELVKVVAEGILFANDRFANATSLEFTYAEKVRRPRRSTSVSILARQAKFVRTAFNIRGP